MRTILVTGGAGFIGSHLEMLNHQPGDVSVTCADITKAKQMLGYQPKIKIEQGIKRFSPLLT